MEETDHDDTQEIFQECDNFVAKDINLENLKSPTEKNQQEMQQHFANHKQTKNNNNNENVVYVGIFIILLTIYLGVTSVQKCLVSCVENTPMMAQIQQYKEEILHCLKQKETFENNKILERLLEYKDICKDLEIFTKQQEKFEKITVNDGTANDNSNEILKDINIVSGPIEEGNSVQQEDSSGSSGNGVCVKATLNNHKKSKYSIKTTSTKNGFNKYNKSTKAKISKKDLQPNKKNSTAEPIIYLFALVFIYLLLKAASDINQHYKSQNKNDKRLRRCSLQSYAQTQRSDRRASKELALKQKQQQLQRIKLVSRTSSEEQQSYHYNRHYHEQQQYFIGGAAKRSSELKQQITADTAMRSYSNNWQLLRQHTTTQSLDNSDILSSAETPATVMARRCSVPAALNYQRQKISNVAPLTLVNDHMNFNSSLSRRSSIVSTPLPCAMDANEPNLGTETKRRVRMINRH